MYTSRVGFHLRLHTSVSALARTSKALGTNCFQFFLHCQDETQSFFLSKEDEKIFLTMRSLFTSIYLHGSYLINLATDRDVHSVLEREMVLAKRLDISHYVLHPGAIEKGVDRITLLDRVVRALNSAMSRHTEIIFCIENTTNPHTLLGGVIEDLFYIQERIALPERFAFCIDTAHAHAAGYPLGTLDQIDHFIDRVMAYNCAIALIHLNDTQELCGSFVDCHAQLGQGVIGMDMLQAFVQVPALSTIPLLIESPELSFDAMQSLLHTVKKW